MKFSFNYKSSKPAKPLKKWQQILLGVLFAFIGGFMLIVSINQISDYKQKDKTFTPITATVVSYDTNSDGLQAIVVEYAVGTTIYREKSNVYSNMPKNIGTKVDIKYNPNDPKDIIWVEDSTNFILPLTSVIFIVCGFLICIGSFKKKKDPALEAPIQSETTNINQELPPSARAQMIDVQQNVPVTSVQEQVVQQPVPVMENSGQKVEDGNLNINN